MFEMAQIHLKINQQNLYFISDSEILERIFELIDIAELIDLQGYFENKVESNLDSEENKSRNGEENRENKSRNGEENKSLNDEENKSRNGEENKTRNGEENKENPAQTYLNQSSDFYLNLQKYMYELGKNGIFPNFRILGRIEFMILFIYNFLEGF